MNEISTGANSSGSVVIAGGSGFLGQSLSNHLLRRGYKVIILSRTPKRSVNGVTVLQWDAKTIGTWVEAMNGAKAIINLVGKSVDCRYTEENKVEILQSRLDSVKVLADAISKVSRPPQVWIQAGSLAIFGNSEDTLCTEETPLGSGFSAEVCKQWEAAFEHSCTPHTRKVLFRIGFALDSSGGALNRLSFLAKWFLGGTIGTGQQFISWLHVADLNEATQLAIENESMRGIYNAASPSPVTNREFMRELRRSLGRRWGAPAPTFLVKIGTFILRTEAELALHGRRAIPKRLLEEGFQFRYTDLASAMDSIFKG